MIKKILIVILTLTIATFAFVCVGCNKGGSTDSSSISMESEMQTGSSSAEMESSSEADSSVDGGLSTDSSNTAIGGGPNELPLVSIP